MSMLGPLLAFISDSLSLHMPACGDGGFAQLPIRLFYNDVIMQINSTANVIRNNRKSVSDSIGCFRTDDNNAMFLAHPLKHGIRVAYDMTKPFKIEAVYVSLYADAKQHRAAALHQPFGADYVPLGHCLS